MPLLHPKAFRILSVTLVASVVGVYLYSLFGGFLFDDYHNIVNNPLLPESGAPWKRWIDVAFSSNAGMLHRPVSMLTFGLNHYAFGMDAVAFKAVNLAIHLLCGLLLFCLVRVLTPMLSLTTADRTVASSSAKWIALAGTAIWLLHPLHVSTVAYVVQRMTLLAALFVLAGLLCYSNGRLRMVEGRSGAGLAFSGLLAFGVLAALSKENGALIIAYALVIEVVCFGFKTSQRTRCVATTVFFIITLAVPGLMALLFVLFHPDWLATGYAVRDFTLQERILTEPRVLLHYLLWILVPAPSMMGLYHDDIGLSTSLLSPTTTLPSIAALIALLGLAWKVRSITPGITFAVCWFLVGHSMESTVLPLELAFEHRNYLPMAGLIAGLCCTALSQSVRFRLPYLIPAMTASILALLVGITAYRGYIWSSPLTLATHMATNHPDSPRSLYAAGQAMAVLESGAPDLHKSTLRMRSREYFSKAMTLDPRGLHVAIAYILSFYGQQIPVDGQAISELERRLKDARIVDAMPFLKLIDATTEGELTIEPPYVRRLIEASLDNPVLTPNKKAMILNSFGRYHFNVLNDAQGAVGLTLAATHEDPLNPVLQINLARLALSLGLTSKALEHIQLARALDEHRLFDTELQEITDLVVQTEASRSSPQVEIPAR
jgi:protein O-mannosyl-transferase